MMLQKNELNIPSSRLTAAEKQIGASAMRYAGSGGAQNMMTDLSQHTLSASQLRRVREQNEEDGTTKNSSAATKVMEYLRHEANLGKKSYKALFHEVSESSLVAVKKAKQKKQRDKKRKIDEQVQKENSTLETPNQQVAATYNNNDDRDLLDELTSHTVQLQVSSPGTEGTPEDSEPYNLSTSKEKLALGETLASLSDTLRVGQKILLGVAWCRKDEQKLFELFPEVLMFDVTFGTNTESRPLGVSASMDGNMNVFTPFRVFMPSQCQWVFDWIIGNAMPSLLGESLKRVQLFMSDGDSKIYSAYDKFRTEYMPNSRHQLCMYHLVTKGLEDLTPQLSGLDRIDVTNQIATFKYTVLSWTGIGGVETETEYKLVLKELRDWLKHWSHSQRKQVASNSTVLDVFLTKKILIHKSRWFFPLRKHLMTLAQRTTSALEGVNQTIKSKSSKVVTPNMTLIESLKTQDQQCKLRMDQYTKKTIKTHLARPLWSASPTATHVTKICESHLQQNYEQHDNYVCKVISPMEIHVVRKPECAPFCEDCTDDVICGLCHKNSPIIRLKRRRIITTQLCALSARYIVRCSCPYQPTFGIPCRHVCKLLRIKKEHVFVRWHTEYAALYHRTGHESRRKGFSSMRYDHTLSIDKVEYSEMLRLAQESQTSTVDIDSINLFRVPFEAHQKMKHGVVPSQLFADDDVDDSYDTNELVLVDSELSQELGGGMTQEEGGNGTINDSHFNSHTMRTGNRYIDMNSQLQYMYGMLETDTAMLNNFEQKLQSIITEFHQQMHLNNRTKADTTGEFVSFFPAVDKRRVYQRKKSRFERTKKVKRKQKPVYSKITKMSNDSMMV